MRNKPFLSLRRYNFFGNSIRKSRGLTEDEAVGGGGGGGGQGSGDYILLWFFDG